ncbi:transglycosylase SLT domain-containing protein [Allonocardiopsis opalescens]|uniref:aggregation-promoting factor C-terminal-like domain-containing protein n=1 Tax=Allonocardiopsis opalescens TaxID=1144618 RepID=UPI0011B211BA|nr:transglycosylase SLT domain-containing protein [Allonocardiopsis opalescens]
MALAVSRLRPTGARLPLVVGGAATAVVVAAGGAAALSGFVRPEDSTQMVVPEPLAAASASPSGSAPASPSAEPSAEPEESGAPTERPELIGASAAGQAGMTVEEEEEEPAEESTDSGGTDAPAGNGPVDPGSNRALGREMLADHGWGESEWPCLDSLWERESNWNHQAQNPSSGAYGIPQALPGTKMATAGDDWETNPATQITWGLGYIEDRYGSPCGAWEHSEANGWY